jgi:hypothetical protein
VIRILSTGYQYYQDVEVSRHLSETGTTKFLADLGCGAVKAMTALFSYGTRVNYCYRSTTIDSLKMQVSMLNYHKRQILDGQLRINRQSIACACPAEDTRPPAYHGMGTMPFGCPTGLNADVAVGQVRRATENPSGHVPFLVDLSQPPTTAPRNASRHRFRSRKYCKTCGFKRSNHIVSLEGVALSCARSYCGRCCERKGCHGNNGFGLTCTKSIHPWQASTVDDWYETVLELSG